MYSASILIGARWNFSLPSLSPGYDDVLERAKHLDLTALAQVHDRYYPEIYRYVRYRLDGEQIVEDIASEVFLRLLDALHKKRGPTQNLRGWLFGTASNLVNDFLRHQYARPTEEIDLHENTLVQPEGLETSVENAWQVETVRIAIRRLTLEQQHVLTLRFADDLSLEETALIIGKSVTAVKALQFRALASLRKLLSDQEEQ
jgi:RNA polymerase sigma-70 factor (ECF subfamily)